MNENEKEKKERANPWRSRPVRMSHKILTPLTTVTFLIGG